MSSPKKIIGGVPQGSILGPLLFLSYVSDLSECLKNTIPSLYADDTEIYASSYDSIDLVSKLNQDLKNVRTGWKKISFAFIPPNQNICLRDQIIISEIKIVIYLF